MMQVNIWKFLLTDQNLKSIMVFIGIVDMMTFFCLYNFKFLQILSHFLRLKEHRHIYRIFSPVLQDRAFETHGNLSVTFSQCLGQIHGIKLCSCPEPCSLLRGLAAQIVGQWGLCWQRWSWAGVRAGLCLFCLHKVCLSAGDLSVSASDNRQLHPAIPVCSSSR